MEIKRYVQEYGNDIIMKYAGIDRGWATDRVRLIKRTMEMHKRYMMTATEAVRHITCVDRGMFDETEESKI